MKRASKPKLVVRTLTFVKIGSQGLHADDPITTSGTICTLPNGR